LKILGFIPCRSNSKGVPNKGLINFGKKSLVALTVQNALNSKNINKVVFSSDGQNLINEAVNAGAEAPFLRPDDLARDNSSTWDVLRHCISFLKLKESYIPDIVVILQPTTPFRTSEIVDKCIDKLILDKLNACITITEVDYPPQWMYKKNNKNHLINYIEKGIWPSRRQDAEKVYKPNGMIYAFKLNCLQNKLPIPTSKMGYVFVNRDISINIDEAIDVKLAKLTWSELYDKKKTF